MKKSMEIAARCWIACGISALYGGAMLNCSLVHEQRRYPGSAELTPFLRTVSLFLPMPWFTIPSLVLVFWLVWKAQKNGANRAGWLFASTIGLIIGLSLLVLWATLKVRTEMLALAEPASSITWCANMGYLGLLVLFISVFDWKLKQATLGK